ncbi:MAG: S8 family serine peptidase, partial [Ilumatobacter sp.]|nr:S8 family serine peptidase [Ilumatobacter sp.]
MTEPAASPQRALARSHRGRVWRSPRRFAVGLVATALVATIAIASDDSTVRSHDASDGVISLSMTVEPGQAVPLELIRGGATSQFDDLKGTGHGVDVALIDSGVAPVAGLDQPGKVIHGPDLSNEAMLDGLTHLDTYGHGTHLAGIINGDDGKGVLGIAPDSRIVSVKVAGATGETHLEQIIAAIDWVVEHKNDNGLNIRVLNLSLGMPGVKTNVGDPLSAAVERAWAHGIVVVAAAGNRGNRIGGIDSPAVSPYVLAVGAHERYDTAGERDRVPDWTSGGNDVRTPDVLAPGQSIMSFRVPGSMLDTMYPEARVDERYFKGSGTSQAAAVVSGYAAALISRYPGLTPDQTKFLFEVLADDMVRGQLVDGSGKLDPAESALHARYARKAPAQKFPLAISTSDIGLSSMRELRWTGGGWNGASWSGGSWSGASWAGASWSGASWSGASWSSGVWSGASWSGASWSGASWSGASWS